MKEKSIITSQLFLFERKDREKKKRVKPRKVNGLKGVQENLRREIEREKGQFSGIRKENR